MSLEIWNKMISVKLWYFYLFDVIASRKRVVKQTSVNKFFLRYECWPPSYETRGMFLKL